MVHGNARTTPEIGNRTRHPDDSMVRTCRQSEPVHRAAQQFSGIVFEPAHGLQVGHGKIAVQATTSKRLPVPGGDDAPPYRRRTLRGRIPWIGIYAPGLRCTGNALWDPPVGRTGRDSWPSCHRSGKFSYDRKIRCTPMSYEHLGITSGREGWI